MSAAPAPRICVVDDEPKQVEALCRTLSLEGYEAQGFTSSQAALYMEIGRASCRERV